MAKTRNAAWALKHTASALERRLESAIDTVRPPRERPLAPSSKDSPLLSEAQYYISVEALRRISDNVGGSWRPESRATARRRGVRRLSRATRSGARAGSGRRPRYMNPAC